MHTSDSKSSRVNTAKRNSRACWRATHQEIAAMVGDLTPVSASTHAGVMNEAVQDLSLDELFDQLNRLVREDTKKSIQALKGILDRLPGIDVVTCSFNKMLLTFRLDIQTEDKHTESLDFRATNALHVSGSDLEFGTRISFEASILEDGVALTGVSGINTRLLVFKSRFKSQLSTMRVVYTGGSVMVKLTTRNPLIEQTDEANTAIELEADLNGPRDCPGVESDQSRQERARHLRETYTNMKALDNPYVNHLSREIPLLRLLVFKGINTALVKSAGSVVKKPVFAIYAALAIFVAVFLFLLTSVPVDVPIILVLSSVSFLLLSMDTSFTSKSKIAVGLIIVSFLMVAAKLQWLT